jgi:heme exporter protein B
VLTGSNSPAMWMKILAGYDVIFTTVSLLLFDAILHAE